MKSIFKIALFAFLIAGVANAEPRIKPAGPDINGKFVVMDRCLSDAEIAADLQDARRLKSEYTKEEHWQALNYLAEIAPEYLAEADQEDPRPGAPKDEEKDLDPYTAVFERAKELFGIVWDHYGIELTPSAVFKEAYNECIAWHYAEGLIDEEILNEPIYTERQTDK